MYDDKEARRAAREVWQGMSDMDREPYEVIRTCIAQLLEALPGSIALLFDLKSLFALIGESQAAP